MKDTLRCSTRAWKFIAIYYALACVLSCLLWAPIVLGQNGLRVLKGAPEMFPGAVWGTLGPLLACFATHRLETGNWRAVHFVSWQWQKILWILLGPLLVCLCVLLIFPLLASQGTPRTWHWHASALAVIPVYMFGYNLLGGPLFEEFGWRGFLQPRLQSLLAPWAATLCVGIMWAAWHFPLFLVRGWTSATPLGYLFIMTGLSVVMAFGFNASGQSIIAAIVMHSAFNVSAMQVGEFLKDTTLREHPQADWLFATSFWMVGLAFIFLTRGSLGVGRSKPSIVDTRNMAAKKQTACSEEENCESEEEGQEMKIKVIAKVQPNPAKQRDTENICAICRRKFKEHSDQEFAACWKELMIEHDIWQISHPEPNYAYGPVVLFRAAHYLEQTHGRAQEAAAIELLNGLRIGAITGGD